MSAAGAAYHFLPWVRFGVLARAATPDPFNATLPPHLETRVKLRVNNDPVDDVTKLLTMYGPGDIVGIDPREVARTQPRHLTPDFSPNLFASVDFDRPDFPWLFTPASPSATNPDALRPWIVLVVVRKAAATIASDARWPLPKLTCPVSELPDLTESWLWAHGAYTGSLDDLTVDDQLALRPNQSVSRLLCPRKLEPGQGGPDSGYYACVVPVFEVGRKAGLNESPSPADATSLRLAWDVTTPGVVQLPVYYQWEFNTGPGGDFEEAVDRLQLRNSSDTAPVLMDATHPGGGVPDSTQPMILPVSNALRPVDQLPPTLPAFDSLRQALRSALEAPLATAQRVPPPIYGRWQVTGNDAFGTTPLAPGTAPPWLRELNTDPRHRVAAALGARVVQHQQEQLVAAAWDQAGEAQELNQWLRQKQLGREVSRSVYKRLAPPLSSVALQQITAPAAIGATTVPPPAPAAAAMPSAGMASAPAQNPLVNAVMSSPFRRIARPFGPMARQASAAPPAGVHAVAQPLAAPAVSVAQSLSALLANFVSGTAKLQVVPQVETAPLAESVAGTPTVTPTPPDGSAINAQTGHSDGAVRARLDPDATFALEANARVVVPADVAATRPDALSPVMLTPTFPEPMYEPLREMFAQMLLPGLERIPNNSVMVLDIDAAFVEAYMAGLNDEMSRELLWREFPTSLRGTYFRQFWDVRAQLAPGATENEREALRDIPPMAGWQASLGQNMPAARRGLLFLLFKGDLLTRFPTALVYAARAKWGKSSTGADIQVIDTDQAPALPQMRVTPAPGVTMLGFSLMRAGGVPVTAANVAGRPSPPGDAGWFFVIEEQPTEPSFGLDATASALTTWRELAWPHVTLRGDGSQYISVRTSAPILVEPPGDAPQEERDRNDRDATIPWGRDAAAMAYITLQQPFRKEIHAAYWFQWEGST